MSEDSIPVMERLFDFGNIMAEIEQTKAITEKAFAPKIEIISGLIEHETKLGGIYSNQCMTKQQMGSVYEDNVALNNTVGNQPYRSISTLLLIRNSLYGSARPTLRQFFESLIIAKYAELDPSLASRWHAQDESTLPSKQVSLTRDVLSVLTRKGKEVGALRQTWRDLCLMSHATRQSQQVLRVPDLNDPEQFEKYLEVSNYFGNTEYSLDLLFLMLVMNFHLIVAHLGRKAYRWWFGYVEDPFGSYKRERVLKKNIRLLINQYFVESKNQPFARKMLRKNIFEYRRKWA